MSNLQTNCCLKPDFQRVDKYTRGMWWIHGTMHRKDNSLQSLTAISMSTPFLTGDIHRRYWIGSYSMKKKRIKTYDNLSYKHQVYIYSNLEFEVDPTDQDVSQRGFF